MKKIKLKREKFTLWFSKTQAKKGKIFYVPLENGDKLVECTAITRSSKPPSKSAKLLTMKYLRLT
jgi:hypothetical protein